MGEEQITISLSRETAESIYGEYNRMFVNDFRTAYGPSFAQLELAQAIRKALGRDNG